jgi:RNA polymerase primary sigma factor
VDNFEDQFLADSTDPLGLPFDEETNYFHPEDVQEEEFAASQPVEESIYTDDPVRVYLREMGAVPLLTREGEVDLARKMERGKLRMQKAISRSVLVQLQVVEIAELIRKEAADLDDYVDLGDAKRPPRPLKSVPRSFASSLRNSSISTKSRSWLTKSSTPPPPTIKRAGARRS